MRIVLTLTFSIFMFTTVAFSQQITDYRYDPGDATHPFKLTSLVLRPPIALLDLAFRGFYGILDAEPIERAFNIEYPFRVQDIDSDY